MSPIFLQDDVLDEARYEVSFIAEVPALGLTTYKLLKKRLSESFQ